MKKIQPIIRAVVKLVTFPSLFKQAWEWDYRKHTTHNTLYIENLYLNYELSGADIFVAVLRGSSIAKVSSFGWYQLQPWYAMVCLQLVQLW